MKHKLLDIILTFRPTPNIFSSYDLACIRNYDQDRDD